MVRRRFIAAATPALLIPVLMVIISHDYLTFDFLAHEEKDAPRRRLGGPHCHYVAWKNKNMCGNGPGTPLAPGKGQFRSRHHDDLDAAPTAAEVVADAVAVAPHLSSPPVQTPAQSASPPPPPPPPSPAASSHAQQAQHSRSRSAPASSTTLELPQTPRGVPWWLSSDLATLKTDVAFGLYANPSGDVRLDIIASW
jgi:hypothetical protein